MSVYFLLVFAKRLGLLCPMGISGDYEQTNGRPALVPPNTQPAKFLLRYKHIFYSDKYYRTGKKTKYNYDKLLLY